MGARRRTKSAARWKKRRRFKNTTKTEARQRAKDAAETEDGSAPRTQRNGRDRDEICTQAQALCHPTWHESATHSALEPRWRIIEIITPVERVRRHPGGVEQPLYAPGRRNIPPRKTDDRHAEHR